MAEPILNTTLHTVGRLKHAIYVFVKSSVGKRAKFLIGILLFLMLCINGMNVVNSYVFRDLMSSIERQEMPTFIYFAWLYAGVFAISTITAVLFRFTEERLGLLWRTWLTGRIIHIYIDKKLYRLSESDSISNPDQRISEDVRSLTATTISFSLMILNSSITIISFSGVLWAISPSLFLVSLVYAAMGSVLTIILGKPLMKLNYRQADFEADFRSELIRARENARQIAESGEEAKVKAELLTRLENLTNNLGNIISVNRNLGFFTTGYNYMIQLIPILFVAPIFIHRGVDFGIIGQSAMAFSTMVAAFSLIVTQFNSISAFAAVITRLGELADLSQSQPKST